MRVALLSPYHGGSHRAWAEGLVRHSSHTIELLTLPARFWKWRMHGGALTLADRFRAAGPFDLLVATDMLDLSTFLALTRATTAATPALLYAHENQITYPLPPAGSGGPMRRQAGERDRHYGFINVASMLAADAVAFNSEFHRRTFLEGARRFLRHLPEHREVESVARIERSSTVLHVGVEVSDLPQPGGREATAGDSPLVLWNQRWEYDKEPREAFAALGRLAAAEVPFRLAVCGERFGRVPPEIGQGLAALADRVEHVGWLPRRDYVRLLGRTDVVLSTARHEFFGVAVVEAVCAGACPVLPRRLAYPEILPEDSHRHCLYDSSRQLDRRLATLLGDAALRRALGDRLGADLRGRFAWEVMAPRYDAAFAALQPRC